MKNEKEAVTDSGTAPNRDKAKFDTGTDRQDLQVKLSPERVAELEAMAKDGTAKRYITKIRNGVKRAYAYGYFNYIKGTASEPDGSYYACGYMAKQAVQIRLNEILRGGSQ